MPIINLKFTLIVVALVALLAFVMRYDYLSEKVKRQDAEIVNLKSVAEEKERVLIGTEKARKESTEKFEAAINELKKRDDCIASGECKRVVRVKQACSLPKAEATSGITEGFAELAPETQRDIADFERQLAEQEHKLNLCLKYARLVSE